MDKKKESDFNKMLKRKMKGEKDLRPHSAKMEMLAEDFVQISKGST